MRKGPPRLGGSISTGPCSRLQLSLEDVSAGAQSQGLDWTRGKVWAIEKLAKAGEGPGTRRLSVSEFLALPAIFERALRERGAKKTFTLQDFLPRENQMAMGVFVIPGDAPATILRGSSFNFDRYADHGLHAARAASSAREQILDMIARREVPEAAGTIQRASRGAAERSVAKKLGVASELVAVASSSDGARTSPLIATRSSWRCRQVTYRMIRLRRGGTLR